MANSHSVDLSAYKTLPPGSTILITGVNGFIASHCADQALAYGYRVRGTVRSLERSGWIPALFDKRYGGGSFQLVEVKDMQQPGAFDEAVEGCSAVIHVATIMLLKPSSREEMIAPTLAGTNEVLKSAAKTPTVKRVVYCSSSGAVLWPERNRALHITQDTWNDRVVELTQDPSQFAALDDGHKSLFSYCASKVLAEKACFDFAKREDTRFTVNSVVPNFNTGPSIHPTQAASSSGLIKAAFLGNDKAVGMLRDVFGPQHHVDVRDDARLHLAAAIFVDVKGERIWGLAKEFNFNDFIDVFQKIDPSRKFAARVDGDMRDLTTLDDSRSVELLQRFGCRGWVSFEDSIRANCAARWRLTYSMIVDLADSFVDDSSAESNLY